MSIEARVMKHLHGVSGVHRLLVLYSGGVYGVESRVPPIAIWELLESSPAI